MELNEPKNEDVVKMLDTLTAEEQLRGVQAEENFDEEMMDYELETFGQTSILSLLIDTMTFRPKTKKNRH